MQQEEGMRHVLLHRLRQLLLLDCQIVNYFHYFLLYQVLLLFQHRHRQQL
jgi:hypothetical protein